MKKKYMQPNVQDTILQTTWMILTGSTMTVDVHDENYDEDNMTSLSRSNRTVWDDDDEEDMCQ